MSAGADGVFGTADDIVDEFGANGVQHGNVAGSDDVIGTRGSLLHSLTAGADGILGNADDVVTDDIVSDDVVSGNLATPTDASASGATIPGLAQSLFIPNITPDAGLSAPANSFFTFFGQFFDHGLDVITKSAANGTVFIPLSPDDPLYVQGAPTNFMVLTRAQDLPGPDGIVGTADDVHSHINQTSPFVDQSQTYGSDPSHQVFLREYMIGADGKLHATGALLGHHRAGADGIAGHRGRPEGHHGDVGRPEGQRRDISWHQDHRRRRELRPAAGDRPLRQLHRRGARPAAARRQVH